MVKADGRICLYFKNPAPQSRWFKGDEKVRGAIRRMVRGPVRISSLEKVFKSLCKGFDLLNVPYSVNIPFDQLLPEDKVVVLGVGRQSLQGYNQCNKIIAGIGLMTHPAEWPDLLNEYPVAKYLQHSLWTNSIYKNYFGNVCDIWFAGIDTDKWQPVLTNKSIDVLVYDKIMWNRETQVSLLLDPVINALKSNGLKVETITYGKYHERGYLNFLARSKSMVFLCEHESQGIAYQEALSMNVPVLAWNQGWWLDPNRFGWGETDVQASSVPYFNERCGLTFTNRSDFNLQFDSFWHNVKAGLYQPRQYVMDTLTLERSAKRMLDLIKEVYPT